MKYYEEDGDLTDIPLVKGGQGRTDEEVLEEAEVLLLWIALLIALGAITGFVAVMLALIEKVA